MVTTMSWLIFFMCFIAAAHGIYEGILAPSFRMKARFDVFELRDSLRSECAESTAFTIIQEQMNIAISAMPNYNITTSYRAFRAVGHDKKLKDEIQRRITAVDTCQDEQLQKIARRLSRIMRCVFLVNIAGWFLYLIPIAIVAGAFGYVRRITKVILNLPDTLLVKFFGIKSDGVSLSAHA